MDMRSLVSETHAIGKNGKISCPQHNENTASCHIYDNGAHCFGCGWSADAVRWLCDVRNFHMKDAIAYANKHGLRDAVMDGGEREERQIVELPGLRAHKLSERIDMNCRSRHVLVDQRRLWPRMENRLPNTVRRLSTKNALECGLSVPKGTRGVLLYAFADHDAGHVSWVSLEAVDDRGEALLWDANGGEQELRLQCRDSTPMPNGEFTVRGESGNHTVVLCESPPIAMAARWLHCGAKCICNAQGGSPQELPLEADTFLAEGSPKWYESLNDKRWQWVERTKGNAALDLKDIAGDDDISLVAEKIKGAGGDYRILVSTRIDDFDPFVSYDAQAPVWSHGDMSFQR